MKNPILLERVLEAIETDDWQKKMQAAIDLKAELKANKELDPIKLWGDSSEPNILKRGLVDAHGRKYELMSGTISVCNFVGFQKLLEAGLVLRASELPTDEDGKTFCRLEVVEAPQDVIDAYTRA